MKLAIPPLNEAEGVALIGLRECFQQEYCV